MDEKPAHDKPMEGRNNSKGSGGTDAQNRTKARITTQPVLAAPHEVINIGVILAKVPPGALGLFIMNSCDLVIVEQAEKVTLGRNVDGTEPSVVIDLTPYGGGPLGVSRRHAAILISKGVYLLQDLGSTNGTWLNEQRLPPHIPRTLNSGDLVRLGQARIHIAFHGSKQGQDSGNPEATE